MHIMSIPMMRTIHPLYSKHNPITLNQFNWLKKCSAHINMILQNLIFNSIFITQPIQKKNRYFSETIYNHLNEANYITKKIIQQTYNPDTKMFLPNQFIQNKCPRYTNANQYNNNCKSYNTTYSPNNLKNPISTISNATPIEQKSEHHFFQLPNFESILKT